MTFWFNSLQLPQQLSGEAQEGQGKLQHLRVEEASAERRPPVQEEEEVLVLRKQEEDELSERMIGSTAPSYLGSEQRWHHQMRRQSKQGTLTKSPTNSSFFK
jgi:hypothetical protein